MMNGTKVFRGVNCDISTGANIQETVIWDNVAIADDAKLARTIIGDNVTIKSGERYENAAIVRADMVRHCDEIPEKAIKGEFVGDNYVVSLK